MKLVVEIVITPDMLGMVKKVDAVALMEEVAKPEMFEKVDAVALKVDRLRVDTAFMLDRVAERESEVKLPT
jgi:hypothetical protein